MLDYIDHDVKDGHLKYGLDVYVSELHDWLYCKAFIEQCRDRYMNEKQRMLDELYECMTCDCLEGSCQQRAFEERQRDIIIPEEAAKKVAHQWLDEQVRKDNVSSARYTTIKKMDDDFDTVLEFEQPTLVKALKVEHAKPLNMTYIASEEIDKREAEIARVLREAAGSLSSKYLTYSKYYDEMVQLLVRNPHAMQNVMVGMLPAGLSVSAMQFYFDRVEYCLNSIASFEEQHRQLRKVAREFIEEIFGEPVSSTLHSIKMRMEGRNKRGREFDDDGPSAKRNKDELLLESISHDCGLPLLESSDNSHKRLAALLRDFDVCKQSIPVNLRGMLDELIEYLKFLLTQGKLEEHQVQFVEGVLRATQEMCAWVILNYGKGDDYEEFCNLITLPDLEKLHRVQTPMEHVKLMTFIDYLLKYDTLSTGQYIRYLMQMCTEIRERMFTCVYNWWSKHYSVAEDVEILTEYQALWERFCFIRCGQSYRQWVFNRHCFTIGKINEPYKLRLTIQRPERLSYNKLGESCSEGGSVHCLEERIKGLTFM